MITRKIGKNRGKPRLWLEGRVLLDAEMNHGDRWDLVRSNAGVHLRKTDDGKRKIAGKPDRPIIDINKDIGFQIGTLVELTLTPGQILVTEATS